MAITHEDACLAALGGGSLHEVFQPYGLLGVDGVEGRSQRSGLDQPTRELEVVAEEVQLAVTAGTDYTVFVDGYGDEAGSYVLTIAPGPCL